MIKTHKALILAAGAAAISMASVGGATAIHAAAITTTKTNPDSKLVSLLASKFNLKEADVQAVFDQEHQSEEANQTAKEKTRLDTAVNNGTLTQAQEDLIIAKQQEVKAFMDTLKDKSQADRDSALKTEMDALAQWAKDNNISEQYLHVMGGPGGHGPQERGAKPMDSTK